MNASVSKTLSRSAVGPSEKSLIESTAVQNIIQSNVSDIDYSLLNSLDTGDIILFSGRAMISRIIRFFTRSRWSHIGLVIQKNDQLYILESTTMTQSNDITLGRPVERAISLSKLEERIQSYQGSVAVRKLGRKKWNEALQNKAMEFVQQWHLKPYKNYVMDYLFTTSFRLLTRKHKKLKGLFCSELIAEFYYQLELLKSERESATFVPGSFGHKVKLPFQHELTTEITIKI